MNIFRIFHRFEPVSWTQFVFLAIVVGTGGGLAVIVFRTAIEILQTGFYQMTEITLTPFFPSIRPWWAVVLIPAFGGLLVGIIVRFIRIDGVQGHGVPEVMESIVQHNGKIRLFVAPVKALLSAITIASGGSAGQEGPIAQIGAAIGSSVGQTFRIRPEYIKVLLASGAAAGIAGAFNAPLGGTFFAWEVLFPHIKKRYLPIVLIAAVMGTVFTNSVLMTQNSDFQVTLLDPLAIQFQSIWDIPLYLLLGVVAAGIGSLYIHTLYSVEEIFDAVKISPIVKPAIGGLGVGLIALAFPQILGFLQYEIMNDALVQGQAPVLLAALILGKILATSLTLGSGGSGGVFAPSLFVGAMLGGVFGTGVQMVFPSMVLSIPSYTALGIGVVFASVAHAPFTAAAIVLEMSGGSWLIAPMVVTACYLSFQVTKLTHTRSIYTEKLYRERIKIKDFR